MPFFEYQALKPTGESVKGALSATDKKAASAELRAQGLMPTDIWEKSKAKAAKNLRGQELLTFTMLLSQMLVSGIPLYESLMAIQEQFEGERFHSLLVELCEHIKAGDSLSKSMSYYPKSFDSLYCSMIEAGESSGSLEQVLERLVFLLKRKAKFKKELVGALLYPAIIAVFCFLVIIVMLTFVVPTLENLVGGRPTNAFTSLVFTVSHILKGYWFVYIPVLVGLFALLMFYWKSESGQEFRNKIVLKLPFIKSMILITSVARFSRTLSTLLIGGVPLLESLEISKNVVTNTNLKKIIENARKKVEAGSSLGKELARSSIMPQLFVRMVKIGEESGRLNTMLNSVAEIYEDNTEKVLTRFATLAQPLILIFMGGIIGVIMVAVLLPLTDISVISG